MSRYWVGSAGGNTNDIANWSAAQNSCGVGGGASVPSTTDTAFFTSSCTNGATINAAFTPQGINIQAGYIGTITQGAGVSISVGSASYIQSDGTFTGSDGAITIDQTDFSLSNGIFTSTSGIFSVGRNFTISSGTFNANGGTLNIFYSATTTMVCNSTVFNLVTINKSQTVSINVGSDCTLPISGTNPTSSGQIINNGTINVTGNWTITGSYTSNTGAVLTMSGTTMVIVQNLTLTAGTFPAGITDLTLGGNLTNTGNLLPNGINLTVNTLANSTYNCGTATFSSVTISKGSSSYDVTVGSSCTFPIAGTNPTSTGDINNNGTISVTGNWTITGSYTSNTGSILTMTGTSLSLTQDLTLTDGTFPAGITTLTLGGDLTNTGNLLPNGTNLTLNGSTSTYNCGTATFSSVVIDKASGSFGATIGSNCTFPIAGINPVSRGNIINSGTINVIGDWTLTGTYNSNAGAVLTMTGTSLTVTENLTLTAGTFPAGITTLTLGGNLTNTANLLPNGIALTINSGNATYNCGTATFSSVVIDKGFEGFGATIGSNCTFPLAGTDPVSTGNIINNGTINVIGNWTIDGYYTSNAGAVLTMTGTSLTLTNNLTLVAGTFPSGITSLTISGGVNNSGNLLPNNIALSLTSVGDGTIICGSAVYASILINKGSTADDLTLGSNCTMGDFTMGGGGDLLNPASPYIYTITGNFVQSGTGTAGGANLTLKLAGSGTQLMSQTANTLATPLQIDSTGIVQLTTDVRSATTCSVLAGTLFLNGNALNCSGGTTVSSGAILQLIGNDYAVPAPTLSAGSIVKIVGDGDSTADTYLLPNWLFSNLEISMTDGADTVISTDTFATNLTGYWKMDEGSGTTVDDSSVNNNIGNITNATFSATVPTTVFANPYSLSFDGAGDYLNIGNSSPLGQNKSEITVTAWVRLNNVTGAKDVFGLSTGTITSNDRANLQINADELRCQGRSGDAETTQTITTSAANLAATTWYHVACTFDYANDSIRAYINGFEFPAAGTMSFTAAATSDTVSLTSAIGIDQDKSGNDFSGFIDDVRFYDRLLSTHELGILANGYDNTTVTTTTIGNTFTQTSGGFTAPTTMNVAGDFIHSGGTFTHNNGTVVLNGADQTISGTTTFNNLTKNVLTQRTLTFPAGVTQTILGTTSLTGTSGNILYLVSSSPTTRWIFDPQGTRDIEYVNVTDSNNINGTTIAVTGNNIEDGGNNLGWDFDVDPPTTPGTPSTTTPTNDTTPVWTWSASADIGVGLTSPAYNLEWSIDSLFAGGVNASTSDTNSFTHSSALSEDTWYFRVKATDNNGNESPFSPNGSVVIDTTAPSISLTALTPDPTNDSTPTFTGTATDGDTILTAIEFQIDLGLWTACLADDGIIEELSETFNCTTGSLIDGSYTINVRATDSAANTTSGIGLGTDTFTVDTTVPDTTPPSISLTVFTPDPTTDTTPSFTGTVTEAVGTVTSLEFQMDGTAGTWSSCIADDASFDEASETFSCTVATALSAGSHTIYVRATDSNTNTTDSGDYVTDILTITISTPAPTSSPSDDNDDEDSDNNDDDECNDDIGIQPPWLYSAIAQSPGSILLYFTEAADPVDRYDLKYGIKSDDYIYDIEDLGIESESKMTYLVDDLEPNTTYYFKVRGGSGCAKGDWSNKISTTTKRLNSYTDLQFIGSKLESVPIDVVDNAITEPLNEPLPETAEEPKSESEPGLKEEEIPPAINGEGYTVKVKVIDEENKPVEGAKVTMHSEVQEAITDKEGLAVFENVERGDHRVIIAYNGFEGEQALNLVGDVKEFSLEIKIKPQNVMASPIYLWSVGILGALAIFLTGLLLRLRRGK